MSTRNECRIRREPINWNPLLLLGSVLGIIAEVVSLATSEPYLTT